MLRLGRRAALLFAAYVAVILAVVVAGFLGAAVGIWASILWGIVLLTASILVWRRVRAGGRSESAVSRS